MVTGSMGDVNRSQVLAALGDPIYQLLRMLLRQKCIDEDGIALAINERDSIGNPSEIILAGRDALGRATAFLGQKRPVQLSHTFSFLNAAFQLPHNPQGI